MHDQLIVRGAREHNLKGVDLDLPRDSMIVFTGLSGSGKSSLAFDTIFAEGQRRYVESLSSYARQFLGQMDKPDVDFIEGLSPAVSIDQKSTSRNPRSTVGTITEIHDYLRLLFARAGVAHCPECGARIQAQTPQQIVDRVRSLPEGTRFQVLSPVVRGRKGEYQDLLEELKASGYVRAIVDGQLLRLEDVPPLEKKLKHTIEVVVDRLVVREGVRQRLTDSVETALRLSDGLVIIDCIDLVESDPDRRRKYSEKRSCPNDHPLTLDEIEPRTFSFNAPYGACPECSGLGSKLEVDPELVVPDEELSLNQGAVIVWNSNFKYHRHLLEALSKELGFSMDTPWKDLPKKVKDAILNGRNYEVKVKFRNRWGRERSYTTGFEGALTYIQRKKEETESQLVVDRMDSYMREVPCSACQGARLRPEVLAVTIGDLSIAQLSDLSIRDAKDFLDGVTLEERSSAIAAPILTEIQARLNFLVDVGLSYLTLSRGAATLSGGEAQRIRLATQIGSGLVGVLYVLDEPSIGLHQRDNRKLIATLEHLRDLGNTLIVVEHDEETIEDADWIVDVGPGAGENGGWIVHSGTLEELKENKRSLTGQYLSGKRSIVIPQSRRERDPKRQITVKGARENNLKDVTVSFPLSTFTAVTGVSGSGKSTLVNQILYRSLASRLNGARLVPGRHRSVVGTEGLDKVVHVDQSPIGRTPRSNPATYTGVWDQIRKLFAEVPEAKLRGYGPGRFSFNVKGGRCESCKGDGTLKIEMNFLPDVYVPCEVCHGARYNRETLEILYKGKSVADVLNMPIAEAAEFFAPISRIARHLNTLVEVGLGYVRLGQAATTLSGGEAQRVKLASELQRRSTGRTVYVLDEPTTGLHTEDIRKLLLVLQSLVDKGNTVIVIEHNLDVIKSADWVIDMGPEGGSGGGTVVAEGTPEEVAKVHESFTGQFLAEIFEASAQHRAKSK
ncbi:MAG: excinuclease ABC subunit UvrA [Actinomyces sp. oral taxon 181]|uniref:excinuclease ABC subunit UvrA n=1 Tax=Actinomyces sp. oral taxon 181 TaxID=712121 RepID=UPI0025C158C0|nr:excinuclease ABC subunit UvrA [Actinomyces sp. oral taxon 181]MBS4796731.1 excinuclease ABC subunit UvrA [Actinomyces sp. oral taxon 181]